MDTASFTFATPGLTTLKGNFESDTGYIVNATTGALMFDNPTNRALAAVIGDDSAEDGEYVYTIPADAPAGIYTLKIWFNPTWEDDEATVGETDPLSWDGTDLTDADDSENSPSPSLLFDFTLEIDGEPADADEPPILSDQSATYGIKRLDTGVVIVAAGTLLTRLSEGQYRYELTNPVAGVTYRAAFKYVVDGDTLYFPKELTAPPAAPTNVLNRTSRWSVLTAPDAYPVTADEAMDHLRIPDDAQEAAQPQIELYIAAATDYAEDCLDASLMPRTLVANFYDGESLRLPRGPLIEVQNILDRDDTALTGYELKHAGNAASVVLTASNAGYPISIVYRAGHADAAAIPAAIKLAILTHVGTLYENRESVSDKTKLPVPHSLEDFYRRKRRTAGVA